MAAADRSLAEGRVEEAIELLRPHASRPETDLEVSLRYGQALLQNQQASLAIWPLERAAMAEHAPDEARVLFVRALYEGGGVREAIREATAFLAEAPGDLVVRRLRADAYRSNLQMSEALADYDALIEEAPRDPILLRVKIDLLRELGRLDEARKVLALQLEITQAAEVVPEIAAEFCGAATRFELEYGDAKRALAQSTDCLSRHAEDPTAILAHVDALDANEREADATAYLEQAAKTVPKRFRVQHALAKRLSERDRVAEAETVLTEAEKNVGGAQPLLALADLRVSHRDLPGAAKAVVEAIRSELGRGPGDPGFDWKQIPPEALFAFGDVFLSAEDFEHAREIISVLDEDAYRLLLEARLALATGDPKKALELYGEAFRFWPANSGARYLAGVAAIEIGEIDRGMDYYQDALRADAQANDAGIVVARMQAAQGYAGAAFDTLDTFLRKNPDHPQALRDYATVAMASGLAAHAEAARATLATDEAWAGLAVADHARGIARARGLDEARKYLESSPELYSPSHAEALWAWVETCTAQGAEAEAEKKVAALFEKEPKILGRALVWSRVLARRGDFEDARAVLEPVANAEPGSTAAQTDLGKILLELADYDEAIARFERADRLDPSSAEAAYLACTARERAGRSKEGRSCLERFVKRHPWHAPGLLDLVRLRIAEGETSDATAIYASQAARFAGSGPPTTLATAAGLLADLGRKAEAADAFARALAIGRATTADRYRHAQLLVELGRGEEARKEFEAIVAMPGAAEAEAARASLAELESGSSS